MPDMTEHDLVCLMAAAIAAPRLWTDSPVDNIQRVSSAAVGQARAIVNTVERGAQPQPKAKKGKSANL